MPGEESVTEVSSVTVATLIRKHRLCLVITAILVTVSFIFYAVTEPSTYQGEALLSAAPAPVEGNFKNTPTAAPPFHVQEKLWLIREQLFSPAVLQPLIREFHLDRKGNDLLSWLERSWQDLMNGLGFPSLTTPQERDEQTIAALKKRITIKVEAPDAFSLGFKGQDAEEAMNVTNRLADSLVLRTATVSQQKARPAAGFLKSQVDRVKAKLDRQRQEIQAYQSKSDDVSTRIASDLRMLETQQERIHVKTEQISHEQAHRSAVERELRDLESRSTLENKDNVAANTRLQELKLRLKQLHEIYTDRYPEVQKVQDEIRDLETNLAASGSKGPSAGELAAAQKRSVELKADLEATNQRLDSLRKQQNDLVAQMAANQRNAATEPRNEKTLLRLVRDYELTQTEYQGLLQKQTEAKVNERLNRVNQKPLFRIVRRAPLPLEPSGPHRARIAIIGVVASLGLGILFAFISELRDSSYQDADEFQQSAGLRVLATIPAIPLASHAGFLPAMRAWLPSTGVRTLGLDLQAAPKRAMVTLNDPRSIAAEQYGMLAMEIRHRLGRDSCRMLAVTSPSGGEGKTITSLNLSIALSKTMEGKVLLIDSDLRKPRIHECVGLQPDKGFSDLLQQPDDAVEPYLRRIDGLAIIPGGPALDDPLRYLGTEQTQDLFQRLRKQFEFIVVDTPPIVAVADCHILSGLSDGVVIVVRARHTRRRLFKHAMSSFHAPNLIGVVLNGVDYQRSRHSDAYEYYTTVNLGR